MGESETVARVGGWWWGVLICFSSSVVKLEKWSRTGGEESSDDDLMLSFNRVLFCSLLLCFTSYYHSPLVLFCTLTSAKRGESKLQLASHHRTGCKTSAVQKENPLVFSYVTRRATFVYIKHGCFWRARSLSSAYSCCAQLWRETLLLQWDHLSVHVLFWKLFLSKKKKGTIPFKSIRLSFIMTTFCAWLQSIFDLFIMIF